MRLWARHLALGLLLTAAIPATAVQAADNAEQVLLEKASYWRQKDRPDLARESLDKLLAVNPAQPDALYQYGLLELQQGNAEKARTWLLRLQQAAPGDARTAGLRDAVRAERLIPTRPDGALDRELPTAGRAGGSIVNSGSSMPPAGDAQSAVPASAGSSAPVGSDPARQVPPPLETTARSADSDDLVGTPTSQPAASLSYGASLVAPANAGPASVGPTAVRQVASLEPDTVSDTAPGTAVPGAVARDAAAPAATHGTTAAGGKSRQQLAQLELTLPPPVGGYQPPVTTGPVPAQDSLQLDIERSMAQIEAEGSPTLEAGAIYRGRVGQSGFSQLNEVGVPIKGTFSPWLTGTVEATVSPVYLDAGSVSSDSLAVFGANEILAAHNLAGVSPGSQTAGGVLTSLGYSLGPFSAKIGDSASGFPVNNIIGDVAYQPKFLNDMLSFRIEGQRTPVTDSLLSYAGTHASLGAANSLTGGAFGNNGTWGGVAKTGVHGSVFYDNNNIGAFGGFGASYLTGTNVAQNDELEGFIGAYFRPYRTDNSALRVGVDLIYFGFNKNLSYYTFGQGGYFSPQNYEAITFPVEYQGRTGRWSYLGSVALGVQHFNQDSSPFYPNNPYAEAALVSAVGSNNAYYGGSNTTGLAVDLRAQAEYALDNTLSVGVAGSFDNGHSYNEGVVKVYLRKTFSDPTPVTMILPGTPMEGMN